MNNPVRAESQDISFILNAPPVSGNQPIEVNIQISRVYSNGIRGIFGEMRSLMERHNVAMLVRG